MGDVGAEGDRARGEASRLPALDGIRGIAILTVLLGHLTDYGGMHPTVRVDQAFYAVAMLGGLGVDLFFVLSGFLITGILLDARGRQGYFRNFYARRFLRIFPLYYGFLLVLFVIVPWAGLASPSLRTTMAERGWYWAYLANYLIASHGWPAYGGVGHFWSLAVEEQFYIAWPLVIALTGRRTFAGLCGALVLAGPAVRASLWMAGLPPIANVTTAARVDALALGGLIAVLVRTPEGVAQAKRWIRPVAVPATLALAALLVWAGGWNTKQPVIPIGGRTLTIIASAGLIGLAIGARPDGLARRVLSHPVLTFYGAISYGLYVFHPPLLILLRDLGLSVRSVPAIGGSQLLGQAVVTLAGTTLSTAVAYASFRWFESPFLRLKTRFESPHPVQGAAGAPAWERRRVSRDRPA